MCVFLYCPFVLPHFSFLSYRLSPIQSTLSYLVVERCNSCLACLTSIFRTIVCFQLHGTNFSVSTRQHKASCIKKWFQSSVTWPHTHSTSLGWIFGAQQLHTGVKWSDVHILCGASLTVQLVNISSAVSECVCVEAETEEELNIYILDDYACWYLLPSTGLKHDYKSAPWPWIVLSSARSAQWAQIVKTNYKR